MTLKKILFVCTGNTCRSSMAEHLFRQMLIEAGRSEEVEIRSAGVAAFPGDPAADQAIQVMHGKGITSIQGHQATPIYQELVEEADLILTMTRAHKGRLLSFFPELTEKVFTLKEYTYDPELDGESEFNFDVADPFGMPVEVYEKCAAEMEVYLQRLLVKL